VGLPLFVIGRVLGGIGFAVLLERLGQTAEADVMEDARDVQADDVGFELETEEQGQMSDWGGQSHPCVSFFDGQNEHAALHYKNANIGGAMGRANADFVAALSGKEKSLGGM